MRLTGDPRTVCDRAGARCAFMASPLAMYRRFPNLLCRRLPSRQGVRIFETSRSFAHPAGLETCDTADLEVNGCQAKDLVAVAPRTFFSPLIAICKNIGLYFSVPKRHWKNFFLTALSNHGHPRSGWPLADILSRKSRGSGTRVIWTACRGAQACQDLCLNALYHSILHLY